METYLVGGAVRDALLGREVKDRDWVVVGADARAMLAAGYQPVGKDFPVFLHPQSHEEYALARTERKTGRGYTAFQVFADPNVTLEEDLQRGILRHVSPAFAEDPVRILRVARFAARYGFSVAEETMRLMCGMVENGEVHALVAERVWQELAKGLMERQPRRMVEVLRECGALAVLLPEVDALFGVPQRADYHPEIDSGEHTLLVLQRAADMDLPLAERYAALLHDLGKALTPADILPKHIGHDERGIAPIRAVNARWRVPKQCAELAELVCAFHIRFHQVGQIKNAGKIVKLLKECDASRRPERVQAALNVCLADRQGRLGLENSAYPQREYIMACIRAAQQVDTGAIAWQFAGQPEQIARHIDQARAEKIKEVQAAFGQNL